MLASGTVLFAIEIPAKFERSVRRGDKPAMLVLADATDPVASGTALGALNMVLQTALLHDRAVPASPTMPFEIRTHARYNPAAVTALNIVPGLVHDSHYDHADFHRAFCNAGNRARDYGKSAVNADHAG